MDPGEFERDVEPCAEATIFPENRHPIREQDLDREALKVLYRLRDAGFKGYLVGGGVRDLYLGRPPKDFDISTDARPGQLRQLFRNSRTIGRRFRLVQVFFRGNKIIEVSTLRSRSEFDSDGDDQLLPSNNTFGTLEEDAFRRDLTINSLFYEIENHTIIDYVGGVADLERGIIRVVGDPDRRFTRDPVRMMRVIRHAARTGFAIEDETYEAVLRHRDKLHLCPPSRIRDEVLKDLQSGRSGLWADRCLSSSLWSALFPMYTALLATEAGAAVRAELLRICQTLDRIYVQPDDEERQVKVPEHILFAAVLLPWACRHFNLPEAPVRGPGFHALSRKIRDEVDRHVGEQFNIQRMARESITTLLVNLPTLHQFHRQGGAPKWLKKKSYFGECARYHELYLESQGTQTVQPEVYRSSRKEEVKVVVSVEGNPDRSSRGKGGSGPAFSSARNGVFGLRRSHK